MVSAQPFGSDRSVVALDIGVLLGVSGLDMHQSNFRLFGPVLQCAADVFRAVVHADGQRFTAPANDLVQGSNNTFSR